MNNICLLSRITNIDFRPRDQSWLQASLPVGSGVLGFRSAHHLAPSAFSASADGASALMQQLLSPHLASLPYGEQCSASFAWLSSLPEDTSPPLAVLTLNRRHGTRVGKVFHSFLLISMMRYPKPAF